MSGQVFTYTSSPECPVQLTITRQGGEIRCNSAIGSSTTQTPILNSNNQIINTSGSQRPNSSNHEATYFNSSSAQQPGAPSSSLQRSPLEIIRWSSTEPASSVTTGGRPSSSACYSHRTTTTPLPGSSLGHQQGQALTTITNAASSSPNFQVQPLEVEPNSGEASHRMLIDPDALTLVILDCSPQPSNQIQQDNESPQSGRQSGSRLSDYNRDYSSLSPSNNQRYVSLQGQTELILRHTHDPLEYSDTHRAKKTQQPIQSPQDHTQTNQQEQHYYQQEQPRRYLEHENYLSPVNLNYRQAQDQKSLTKEQNFAQLHQSPTLFNQNKSLSSSNEHQDFNFHQYQQMQTRPNLQSSNDPLNNMNNNNNNQVCQLEITDYESSSRRTTSANSEPSSVQSHRSVHSDSMADQERQLVKQQLEVPGQNQSRESDRLSGSASGGASSSGSTREDLDSIVVTRPTAPPDNEQPRPGFKLVKRWDWKSSQFIWAEVPDRMGGRLTPEALVSARTNRPNASDSLTPRCPNPTQVWHRDSLTLQQQQQPKQNQASIGPQQDQINNQVELSKPSINLPSNDPIQQQHDATNQIQRFSSNFNQDSTTATMQPSEQKQYLEYKLNKDKTPEPSWTAHRIPDLESVQSDPLYQDLMLELQRLEDNVINSARRPLEIEESEQDAAAARLSKERPQFKQRIIPERLELEEAESCEFMCRIEPSSDPQMQVEWFHNNEPLREGSRYTCDYEFGIARLIIRRCEGEDSGVYQCRARNQAGEATSSGSLRVNAKEAVQYETLNPSGLDKIRALENPAPVELAAEPDVGQAPKFLTHIVDYVEKDEGQSLHLECNLAPVDDPELKTEWFFNGRPLVTGSRFHTIDDFGFIVLDIDWLFPRDTGEYVCRATNKHGTDLTRTVIRVRPDKNIVLESQLDDPLLIDKLHLLEYPEVAQQETFEEPEKPAHFVQHLTAQENKSSYKEGENVHFEARVAPANDADLTVEWFHDDKPLMNGHRFKPSFDFGHILLDILYVYPEDAGVYKCLARNATGSDVSQFEIQVQGKPSLDYHTQLPEDMVGGVQKLTDMEAMWNRAPDPEEEEAPLPRSAPAFVLKPVPYTAFEGSCARFCCRLVGNPRPRITWSLNGQHLFPGSRYKLWHDGMYHLNIPKCQLSDAGKIEVYARNPLGDCIANTQLQVQPKVDDYRSVLKRSPNPWYDEQALRQYRRQRLAETNNNELDLDDPLGELASSALSTPQIQNPTSSSHDQYHLTLGPSTMSYMEPGTPDVNLLALPGSPLLMPGPAHPAVVERQAIRAPAPSTIKRAMSAKDSIKQPERAFIIEEHGRPLHSALHVAMEAPPSPSIHLPSPDPSKPRFVTPKGYTRELSTSPMPQGSHSPAVIGDKEARGEFPASSSTRSGPSPEVNKERQRQLGGGARSQTISQEQLNIASASASPSQEAELAQAQHHSDSFQIRSPLAWQNSRLNQHHQQQQQQHMNMAPQQTRPNTIESARPSSRNDDDRNNNYQSQLHLHKKQGNNSQQQHQQQQQQQQHNKQQPAPKQMTLEELRQQRASSEARLRSVTPAPEEGVSGKEVHSHTQQQTQIERRHNKEIRRDIIEREIYEQEHRGVTKDNVIGRGQTPQRDIINYYSGDQQNNNLFDGQQRGSSVSSSISSSQFSVAGYSATRDLQQQKGNQKQVHFQQEPIVFESDESASMMMMMVPPEFTHKIQPCQAIEGDEARFECEFVGDPVPKISWFRENRQLRASNLYEIITDSYKSTLILKRVSLNGNAGVFTVKAENEVGSAKSSANLVVEAHPRPLTNRGGKALQIDAEHYTFNEQEEATEEKESSASASGSIRSGELHDGPEARNNKRSALPMGSPLGWSVANSSSHQHAQRSTMASTPAASIGSEKDAADQQAGQETSADPARGRVVSVRTRKLSSEEMAQMIRRSPEGLVAPTFLHSIHDISSRPGELIRLDARVLGSGPLEVRWLKDGARLRADRLHKMLLEADQYTLLILECQLEDSGLYECVVSNRVGEARCSARLTVSNQPTRSSRSRTPEPRSIIQLNHPSSNNPAQHFAGGSSLLSGRSVTPTTNTSHVINSNNSNNNSLINQSESIPKIIKRLESQCVREGCPVTLRCQISSFPVAPQVQWFKDGDQLIKASQYFRIFKDNEETYCLRISEVFGEDAGEYKCVARAPNGRSYVETRAQVTVLFP